MSKNAMKYLRVRAKALKINSFQMSKVNLIAAIEAKEGNPRADHLTARDETGRKERVPLGAPRPKMAAPTRAGYVRRWMNDDGDRIRQAEAGGYQFVEDEREIDESGRGVRVSQTVGTKEDGSPLRAFLMEIRQEFYDADQASKQSKIDEVQTAIERGDIRGAQSQDQDKYYVPDEGISVRS